MSAAHRRIALQIAAQLPPESHDALRVLELTKEIVEKFFDDQASMAGGRSPKLRAISGPETDPK